MNPHSYTPFGFPPITPKSALPLSPLTEIIKQNMSRSTSKESCKESIKESQFKKQTEYVSEDLILTSEHSPIPSSKTPIKLSHILESMGDIESKSIVSNFKGGPKLLSPLKKKEVSFN